MIMQNYYIERVTIKGKDREDATVKFTNGLNIISGPSNTGKTSIVTAIDFLYGAKKDAAPFSTDATGYSKVELIIQSTNGKYSLTREFDSNSILVSKITSSGEYVDYEKYNARSGKNPISHFWLQLLGIDDDYQIIKNEDFKRQKLTWRTLAPSTLIPQDRVNTSASVLFPGETTQRTAFLSSLLLLLYGSDFANSEENETKEHKKIRRNSVINYINSSLSELYENYEVAKSELPEAPSDDFQQIVDGMFAELETIEKQINDALASSKILIKEIYQKEQYLHETQLLLNRYKQLHYQYQSDIERLTLIVDGERLLNDHNEHDASHSCPFCNGELSKPVQTTYIDTARSELHSLLSQLSDLTEESHDTEVELQELMEQLDELKTRKKSLDAAINDELKPKAETLKDRINKIETYRDIKQQLISMEKMQNKLKSDLEKIENEPEDERILYKPKEKFDAEFYKEMSELLDSMLRNMHYKPNEFRNAFFAKDIFDIKINGNLKWTENGHGYTAFINSVVIMAYRHLLYNHAKYTPSVFIIDSPLLGLDERKKQDGDDNMKEGLFKYFMDHQNEGQLIIVENTTNLPALNYDDKQVNQIVFTEDKNNGRYGYLYDIYN
ncbi:AAA family ATPase [Listeria monocytogenes]|nr:AAA family ATPase [Listeria monocytogenes]EKA3829826.1 AAA family ATPase [Listeria monocytogenes]EKA3830168.1 AAA family ATPase [Listeria monocytogenes]EKA3834741.1 AAA family ATPase [Listeria monocytogenes]EKA5032784.1 AAA family ATPase [Listeria monocytogenes]